MILLHDWRFSARKTSDFGKNNFWICCESLFGNSFKVNNEEIRNWDFVEYYIFIFDFEQVSSIFLFLS